MRKLMSLNQTDLDKIAADADELVVWLDSQSKSLDQGESIAIPSKLTVLASTISICGLIILLDGVLPLGGCWDGSGGCNI